MGDKQNRHKTADLVDKALLVDGLAVPGMALKKWLEGRAATTGLKQGVGAAERGAAEAGAGKTSFIGEEGGLANRAVPGLTTRKEMSQLRSLAKNEADTKISYGSRQAQRYGNHFDANTNTIHLKSGSRNQPRGMVREEIQHAIDHATDRSLNDLTRMTNSQLHAGTFERMANSSKLGLTPQEANSLLNLSKLLSGG